MKNTVVSPDFLVWKFCGKAQFPHSFRQIAPKLCGNCAFQQNFHIRKSGETMVFFAVMLFFVLISNVCKSYENMKSFSNETLNFFFRKFRDFSDNIRRAHTVLARSKM